MRDIPRNPSTKRGNRGTYGREEAVQRGLEVVIDGAAPEGELEREERRKGNAKRFQSIGEVSSGRAGIGIFGLLLG